MLLAVYAPVCEAEIFQCRDKLGRVFFQDTECELGKDTVNITDGGDTPIKEPGQRVPHNTVIEDDKPGKLIFSDNRPLVAPYTIKVNEVRVISETDDNLVVDVIYTYEDQIPPEQVKLFVTPNHGYWSVADIKVKRGKNVGRASIGLSKGNMNKDHKTRSFTNTIRTSFEHYLPKKYLGVIWSETVKYEKNWTLKR